MVDDLTGAAAVRAGVLALHLTEEGALDLDDHAGAVAALAGDDLAVCLGSGAAAVITRGEAVVGDRLLAAGSRLLERDREPDAHVTPAGASLACVAAAAGAAPKERREHVGEAPEEVAHVDVISTPTEARRTVGVSVTVVVGTLGLV